MRSSTQESWPACDVWDELDGPFNHFPAFYLYGLQRPLPDAVHRSDIWPIVPPRSSCLKGGVLRTRGIGGSVDKRMAKQFLRPSRIAIAILVVLTTFALYRRDEYQYALPPQIGGLPCRSLPGARDVSVIMRTGVTQIEAALTVHLDTTLKCPPNTIIFSDHQELYQGKHEIRDVLANIDPTILEESEEFELYRKVRQVGRLGLEPGDVTGSRTTSKTNKNMKIDISGWVLDKWKFIPMMNETHVPCPSGCSSQLTCVQISPAA